MPTKPKRLKGLSPKAAGFIRKQRSKIPARIKPSTNKPTILLQGLIDPTTGKPGPGRVVRKGQTLRKSLTEKELVARFGRAKVEEAKRKLRKKK